MSAFNNMIDFNFKDKCYSCSLCGEVCPTKAISYDKSLHPIVAVDKCIGCNLCDRMCIELNHPKKAESILCIEGYIVKNIDNEIRKSSSSGGVFFQLVKQILDMNGYVCGCIYDDKFMPKHIISNDLETCKKMMGSKYVKSDLAGCISKIKQLVNNDIYVLFTGVPCQIAAIKKYIKSVNLITVAVVCHGSIERSIWERYILEEVNTKKSNIKSISMRDKSQSCLNYGLRFEFEDGTTHISYRKTNGYFLKSFTDGLLERNVCLGCIYKGCNIFSDILLGDAWGMEKILPTFVDDLGCSSIITLTERGEEIFNKIKENFLVKKVDVDVIIGNNPRILKPQVKHPLKRRFEKELNKPMSNVHLLVEKYAKPTLINRIIWKILR